MSELDAASDLGFPLFAPSKKSVVQNGFDLFGREHGLRDISTTKFA